MTESFLLNLVKNHIPACEQHIDFLKEIIGVFENMGKLAERLSTDVGFNKQVSVIQFNFLVTNSDLELNLILKNLITAETEWEKKYFMKLANLNIYETINTYNKHKKSIKDISTLSHELSEEFISVNKNIGKFINDYSVQTSINHIRNKTIGHIEKDMKEYYRIVETLDYEHTKQMIYDFMKILQELHIFSTNCVMAGGPQIPDNFDVEKNYNETKEKLKKQIDSSKNAH